MSKMRRAELNELINEARLRIPREIYRLECEIEERRKQVKRLERAIADGIAKGIKE